MRTVVGVLVSVAGLGGAFLLGRFVGPLADPHEVRATPPATATTLSFRMNLVVVVDGGDVYCGKDRSPKDGVEEYVYRTMKLNHAESVIVYGSVSTHYGDVAALVGKLRERGVGAITMSTSAIPSGVRLGVVDTKTLTFEDPER